MRTWKALLRKKKHHREEKRKQFNMNSEEIATPKVRSPNPYTSEGLSYSNLNFEYLF